ncbi:hypothetical protein Taro_056401 [Colocasia esculenta]|uniref:Uncharacterized protein n=1 Tax=Colocasia esculenta TaxID=4460 RepID=A0A843XX86_COLES|nr:hypothetical protein [Colocasia esculenta]
MSKQAIVTVAQHAHLVLAVRWNSRSSRWPCYAQVQRSDVIQGKSELLIAVWTHKQKGTDDYVSESARMIAETCDRMMADHYVKSTHQPGMDPETLVDVVGGPKKGQVYSFGDNLDTIPMLSSYASSVAPPTYTSSSTVTLGGGGEDIRTLIREELSQQLPLHLGTMVEQLVAAIRGVGPS